MAVDQGASNFRKAAAASSLTVAAPAERPMIVGSPLLKSDRSPFSARTASLAPGPILPGATHALIRLAPHPACGNWRQLCGVRCSGFFVLATALPVLTALDEDAGEQGFAAFVR